MHDSSTCPICRGLPTGGSLSDEEFGAFVAACRAELATKQARFQALIAGAKTWNYEMADHSLTIGPHRFAMTLIGTHSAVQQSWLWAWANEDFPAPAREKSAAVRGLFAATGFKVFTDPGLPVAEADVLDLVALAIHQLGASAMFRCPGQPALYLAVHDQMKA